MTKNSLLNLIQVSHLFHFLCKFAWTYSFMIRRANRSHFFEIFHFSGFFSLFWAKNGPKLKKWIFSAQKWPKNPGKWIISKKWLLFPLRIIKLHVHANLHKKWTKWETWIRFRRLFLVIFFFNMGNPITFYAFRENTPNGRGHKNWTAGSWEVVDPSLFQEKPSL